MQAEGETQASSNSRVKTAFPKVQFDHSSLTILSAGTHERTKNSDIRRASVDGGKTLLKRSLYVKRAVGIIRVGLPGSLVKIFAARQARTQEGVLIPIYKGLIPEPTTIITRSTNFCRISSKPRESRNDLTHFFFICDKANFASPPLTEGKL